MDNSDELNRFISKYETMLTQDEKPKKTALVQGKSVLQRVEKSDKSLEFNDAEMEALQNEIEADSESIETSPKRRTRDSAGSGIQAGHQSISFEDESWGSLNDDAIVGSKIEEKKEGKSGLKLNKMTEEEIDEEIKQFDRMDEDDNYSDDDFNFGFGDEVKERERQEAI